MQRRSAVGGWAIAAVLTVIAVLVYQIRIALLPFVFAIAVAFVTDPFITAAQRRLGIRRWPVASVLYLCILAIIGLAGYWFATTATADLLHILATAPDILRHFLQQLLGSEGITLFGQTYTPDRLVQAISGVAKSGAGLTVLSHLGGSVLALVFGTFLTLILMLYFMISAPRLTAGTIWLLPPEHRRSVEELLVKIAPILRRYLIGLVLVVSYTASVAWIGFGPAAHLPHAALLAITVGLLELIPVIGPVTSATIVGLIAVQQQGIGAALFLSAFAIGLRLSIDNLVGPIVLGEAARVHPVVVIISFVCGAILFGVVGLLLAVPVAVCIKITLEHYYAEPIKG
ncbi:MAG: AI-2E family transporter [Alphaproteobacteria bacterium]|nr:AI-2E family transporter [Alphaproteobacteria bacterium]